MRSVRTVKPLTAKLLSLGEVVWNLGAYLLGLHAYSWQAFTSVLVPPSPSSLETIMSKDNFAHVDEDTTTPEAINQMKPNASTTVSSGLINDLVGEEDDGDDEAIEKAPFSIDEDASILTYLNPEIVNNEELMDAIGQALNDHQLVVIRDAFVEEFAEYVWQDLYRDDLRWPTFYNMDSDDFSYRSHYFDETEKFTKVMKETNGVFHHPDSLEWIASLSGRDTYSRDASGIPSQDIRGDFSMPHSVYAGSRTVAYEWNLSKDWNPLWGGALHWNMEPYYGDVYVKPAYNTLCLFSITRYTKIFISVVTEFAPRGLRNKRLAWNGYWEDARELNIDFALEYDTFERRLHLTEEQANTLLQYDVEEEEPNDKDLQDAYRDFQDKLRDDLLQDKRENSLIVDIKDSARGEQSDEE